MGKRKLPKTKLSIYLLKEGYEGDFLKESHDLVEVEGSDNLYAGVIADREPKWVSDFFVAKDLELKTQSVSVVFKTSIDFNEDTKHFIICFGGGHHRLNLNAIEKRFGLKTALSMGNTKQVRAINKKDISATPKVAQEQLSNTSTINSFTIDFQQDILQGITISLNQTKYPKDTYGKTINGTDALSISTTSTIKNIKDLLFKLYRTYETNEYKNNGYDWIDNISQIKSVQEKTKLDELLLDEIKMSKAMMSFAPPELVNWTDFEGFSKKSAEPEPEEIFDEINLSDYITDEELKNVNDIQKFKSIRVNLISSERDTVKSVWTLYNCMNAEIDVDGKKFILTDGHWYEVNTDFLNEIETWWKSLNILNSNLPTYQKYEGKHSEGNYNSQQGESFEVLDTQFIRITGQSAIEPCDLYKDGKFIHVKIYRTSSDISHLMAQALVSCNLFIDSEDSRLQFNEKLKDKLHPLEVGKPTRNKYQVILAIITNKNEFSLPFFSKINLRTNMKNIERYGLECRIEKIQGDY